MRRVFRSTAIAAIAGALAAAAALLFGADRTDLVLDAYLVFVGGLLALAASRVAAIAFPRPRRIVPRLLAPARVRYARPDSLAALEDVVALAQADQFNLHFRLRPTLADIAAAGLAARHAIDLESESERARAHMSPETWELVRPDRPRPEGTGQRGIDTKPLAAMVTELERILPS